MTTKVLVAGDVRGDLSRLFARAGSVHASKGPFDCLLCVGNALGTATADALTALDHITTAQSVQQRKPSDRKFERTRRGTKLLSVCMKSGRRPTAVADEFSMVPLLKHLILTF